jgi:hypothetical protein
MKTDRYTKMVLTVIAVCLLILVLRGTGIIQSTFIESTKAPSSGSYGLVPLNSDGSINVHIISNTGEQDVIDVRIKSCTTTAFYLAEPISVKIK